VSVEDVRVQVPPWVRASKKLIFLFAKVKLKVVPLQPLRTTDGRELRKAEGNFGERRDLLER